MVRDATTRKIKILHDIDDVSAIRGKRVMTKNSRVNLIVLLVIAIFEIIVFNYFDSALLVVYVGCLFAIFYLVLISQSSNIMSPLTIFMGLYLFFIALGPVGYYYHKGNIREDICGLIIVSLLIFVMGYFFSTRFTIIKSNTKLFKLNYNNKQTIKIVAIVILFMSLVAQFGFVLSNMALLFSGSFSSGRVEAIFGNGLVLYISGLWSFAACLIIELKLKNTKIESYIWVMIVISAILSLAKGFKSALLNFVLTVVLMCNKKKKIKIGKILISLIGVLMFIVVYNSIRDGVIMGSLGESIFSAISNESYVGYINLQYVLNCFPDRHDYMHGYGYLINIIMLGPGNDLDFTLTLKQILGLSFSGGGVTPTILGELYLNFGYVGCMVGMFIIGMVYQKLTKSIKMSESYYVPVWLTVMLCISIRTGIANSEVSLILNLFIYMCICWFSQRYRLTFK